MAVGWLRKLFLLTGHALWPLARVIWWVWKPHARWFGMFHCVLFVAALTCFFLQKDPGSSSPMVVEASQSDGMFILAIRSRFRVIWWASVRWFGTIYRVSVKIPFLIFRLMLSTARYCKIITRAIVRDGFASTIMRAYSGATGKDECVLVWSDSSYLCRCRHATWQSTGGMGYSIKNLNNQQHWQTVQAEPNFR